MALNIQNYLRSGKTPDELKMELGIFHKRHSKYNNLVLFKYDMIDSPQAHHIVLEARGIILDENNDWAIVSHLFNRFFNYGEGVAAEIDWTTARVQTKADGSLIGIYPYNDEWLIQSSGTPDASGGVNGIGLADTWKPIYDNELELPIPGSFEVLVRQILHLKGVGVFDGKPEGKTANYCFVFEMIGPLNKVVVQYKDAGLILLGGRNLETDQEISAKEANQLLDNKFNTIQEFNLTSIADITKTFESMSPLAQEGYVVVDSNFNRIKCKHPGYIALHYMKDSMSTRNMLGIVRAGEISEVIVAFPEYEHALVDMSEKYNALISELECAYDKIKDIVVQKEFALEAVKTRCCSALFSFRAKQVGSIKEFLRNMNLSKLESLLEGE
jgi:hypothetical protein